MLDWEDRNSTYPPHKVIMTGAFIGKFVLRVHRHTHYPPDMWLASCQGLFDKRELTSKDLSEAKLEAVGAVRTILANALAALGAAPTVWPDVTPPPKYDNPAHGREDPKLPDLRKLKTLAREVGYALGLHGSLKRDCDIMAVPWQADAVDVQSFVRHMACGIPARVVGDPEIKPHRRIAVTLQMDGYYKPIDLSVMPPRT